MNPLLTGSLFVQKVGLLSFFCFVTVIYSYPSRIYKGSHLYELVTPLYKACYET